MKKKVLITGGKGDIAGAIFNKLFNRFIILRPSKDELNVTDLPSVENYFKNNGPFDLIINNAGSIHSKCLLESQENEWVQDVMINLVGVYYVSKNGLTQNNQAIIINIASTAAYAAYKDWGSYCSSKAAVVTFTKSMANDNFSAFAIAPGAVLTKFRDNFNLPNDNALDPVDIALVVEDIINGIYNPGDVVFYRKGEKKIL